MKKNTNMKTFAQFLFISHRLSDEKNNFVKQHPNIGHS